MTKPAVHTRSQRGPGGALVTAYCKRCCVPWPCPPVITGAQTADEQGEDTQASEDTQT